MIHLQQTYEILTGGSYTGSRSWNKNRSEIDSCFKIYQLTDGEIYLCDTKQEFLLEKNAYYFINGNKLVSQYCKQSFSIRWLHFIPKDLVVFQQLLSLPLVVDLSAQINRIVHPMPDIERVLSQDLSSFHQYTLELLRMQTFLQSLIIVLFDQYPTQTSKFTDNIERIQPAIQYINEHFKEPIRLEQLAKCCCMSPNYFHKIFTQALNTTPINYISLLRMNTALQLLINSKFTIKEIGYELGFADDAYFCRVFKKYYGITPSSYKKKKGEILL